MLKMKKVSTCCIIFLLIVKEIQSRYQKELNNLPIPGELMARMKKYIKTIVTKIMLTSLAPSSQFSM